MTIPPASLPRPRALLFDLDGTLIDSIELIVRSFEHATETHLGAPLPREIILPTIGRSLREEYERIAPGLGAALIATHREFTDVHQHALVTIYPGVLDMLEAVRARGLPTALVTSRSRQSGIPMLERLLLDRVMSALVLEDDTARHKPFPDPLFHAAALLGLPPATCWYIGDSTHDLHAARAAGMRAVGVTWGPNARDVLAPLADALLDEPADMRLLLDAAV